MNATQLGFIIVTLLSEHTSCGQFPSPVLAALCALNMLMMMEDDSLFVARPHRFKDFTINGTTDEKGALSQAEIIFNTTDSQSVMVDRSAIDHIKQVGHLKALRYCTARAKL